MKDEEMADKLAEELEKKAIDVIRNQSHKLIDNFTQEDLENREISIFLAGYHEGLKAGRPQWHDLRENPKDLPKKNKSYWVYMDCQGNKIYRLIVWQGCWCGWNGIPLAWCEEPTFDKE